MTLGCNFFLTPKIITWQKQHRAQELKEEMERQRNAPAPVFVQSLSPKAPIQVTIISNQIDDRGISPDSISLDLDPSSKSFIAVSPENIKKAESIFSPSYGTQLESLKEQLATVEEKYKLSCERIWWMSNRVSELMNISVAHVTS